MLPVSWRLTTMCDSRTAREISAYGVVLLRPVSTICVSKWDQEASLD